MSNVVVVVYVSLWVVFVFVVLNCVVLVQCFLLPTEKFRYCVVWWVEKHHVGAGFFRELLIDILFVFGKGGATSQAFLFIYFLFDSKEIKLVRNEKGN